MQIHPLPLNLINMYANRPSPSDFDTLEEYEEAVEAYEYAEFREEEEERDRECEERFYGC